LSRQRVGTETMAPMQVIQAPYDAANLQPASAAIDCRQEHLHVDLGVLNPQEASVNHPLSSGLASNAGLYAVTAIGERFPITAAAAAAYVPACDGDARGASANTATRMVERARV
jgi:hypothetical protein